MIKKISVELLKPGFFVHDFNCGWINHPFFKNRIMLKSDKDVEKIVAHGIREVYIDTAAGLDVDDAPTQQEVDRAIDNELEALTPGKSSQANTVPLAERVDQSKALIIEGKYAAQRLLDDIKFGNRVDMAEVSILVDRLTDSAQDDCDTLVSLLRGKKKLEYTHMHSLSVAALCISFGQCMELDAQQIRAFGIGGLLHDIGEVKIPSGILNKPGPLTEDQFETMKQHVAHGKTLLKKTGVVGEESMLVIAEHHERLDGTGYPDGLRGDEISLFGQMSAIVDIYDALTSSRSYRTPLPPTAAMRKLFEWADLYLNRFLVEKFIAHLGIYPIGSMVRLRSGEVAVVLRHGENSLLRPVVRIVLDRHHKRVTDAPELNLAEANSGSDANDIVYCESSDQLRIDPLRFLF